MKAPKIFLADAKDFVIENDNGNVMPVSIT